MSETKTAEVITDADVAWLESKLSSSACWIHADELLTAKGEAVGSKGRRFIRALASASGWVISGNDGYKHVLHATADEISHFVARMQSQIEVMKTRMEMVQRNKNSLN